MSHTLPDDVARCRGVNLDGQWREGCEDCLRRTSPAPDHKCVRLAPPAIVVFECEYRIEP